MFLILLGKTLGLTSLKTFANFLPKSVYSARKLLGKNNDPFAKIICCPKCSTLYTMDNCTISNMDGSKTSKLCSHTKFPNHPQRSRRFPCNALLLKQVQTFAGTSYLYPRQMFCYRSVTDSIRAKLCSPDFVQRCELWRNRKIADNTFEDIFDGKIWKEFLDPCGIPFLSLPFNFALCLNVDWFQPFKHSQYACGAMYLSILSLPWSERYRSGNEIMMG